MVAGYVDTDLPQYLDGPRIDKRGLGPGGEGLETVTKEMIGDSFRHLGPAGVRSAEKEGFFFHLCLQQSLLIRIGRIHIRLLLFLPDNLFTGYEPIAFIAEKSLTAF